jgi:hypothetical protein
MQPPCCYFAYYTKQNYFNKVSYLLELYYDVAFQCSKLRGACVSLISQVRAYAILFLLTRLGCPPVA